MPYLCLESAHPAPCVLLVNLEYQPSSHHPAIGQDDIRQDPVLWSGDAQLDGLHLDVNGQRQRPPRLPAGLSPS